MFFGEFGAFLGEFIRMKTYFLELEYVGNRHTSLIVDESNLKNMVSFYKRDPSVTTILSREILPPVVEYCNSLTSKITLVDNT